MSNHETEPTPTPSPPAKATTTEAAAAAPAPKSSVRLSRAERNAAAAATAGGDAPALLNNKPDALLRRSQTCDDGGRGRRERRQRLRSVSNDGSTGMFGEPGAAAPRRGRKRPTQMAEELQRSATQVALEDLQLGDIAFGDDEEADAPRTPESKLHDSAATPTINEEEPDTLDVSMPLSNEPAVAEQPPPLTTTETATSEPAPAEQPPPLPKEASKTEPSSPPPSEQGPPEEGMPQPTQTNPLGCLACLFGIKPKNAQQAQ